MSSPYPGTGLRDISFAARGRLLAIFGFDDERVDALIDAALASLRDGARAIVEAMSNHEREPVARIAHQLRGIALEIGFTAIAHRASELELAARTRPWYQVIAVNGALAHALGREAGVVPPTIPAQTA